MFTGLIEQQGKVVANIQGEVANRLIISASFDDLQTGESIAVNGVCLTLLSGFEPHLAFDVSPETLDVTTLGQLKMGICVNLERAMLATARFGGHYVSGHVDTMATLEHVRTIDDYIEMTIGGFSACDNMYLLPKGSITLEGVSLTINEVNDNSIRVLLIPHTIAHTTLGQKQAGQQLNVEFDYLTRIVSHQVYLLTRLKHDNSFGHD